MAALRWLADRVLYAVKASHVRDITLNRRVGYPSPDPAGGQLGNQLVVLQPLEATSYVVGSDTVTLDSWRVTVPLLAWW